MPAKTTTVAVALAGGIPVCPIKPAYPMPHCTVHTTCPRAAGDQTDGGEDEIPPKYNSNLLSEIKTHLLIWIGFNIVAQIVSLPPVKFIYTYIRIYTLDRTIFIWGGVAVYVAIRCGIRAWLACHLWQLCRFGDCQRVPKGLLWMHSEQNVAGIWNI